MKAVILTPMEDEKYEVIKMLVDHNGNKLRAAHKLNLSTRQIYRLMDGYRKEGKSFFIHGNHKHKPITALDESITTAVVMLYLNKYYDTNFKHFNELLKRYEKINVSDSTIRNVLRKADIISPKANRSTVKIHKKKLRESLKKATAPEEQTQLVHLIEKLDHPHPRRERCKYAGEMIQLDASLHPWFGDFKSQLHLGIDDSTGMIVGAYFAEQETLNGYYHVFNQILEDYGIPAMFYTDNRTVFEYNRKDSKKLEKDTLTQFAYACKQLGTDIKTTSVPQSKGRVERVFNTLQSRLPVELRLADVTTISEANEFLNSYIKKFNSQFSYAFNDSRNIYETQPTKEKINQTLAVITKRKIDNGSCFRYDCKYMIPIDSHGEKVCYKNKTEVAVIKAFDGNIYCNINDTIYGSKVIKRNASVSRNFDTVPAENPIVINIPAIDHPWRMNSINKFIRESPRQYTFDEVCYTTEDVLRSEFNKNQSVAI